MEWHRLFGLALTDYFTDSSYRVELEKDLSLKQQLLDVVIIEQEANGQMPEVPDGLENLTRHNLMTYKSLRQPLDGWALDEFVGHYVNYRKQISVSLEKLLPVEDINLYAVSTREPEKLAREISLLQLKEGVYEVATFSKQVRIIVLSQVPKLPRNAIWHLYSGITENVRFGASNYQWRQKDHSGIINELYKYYQVENVAMPYTWDDYYRQITKEHLDLLPTEERLKGLRAEERLKGLRVEERLKGLRPEEIEAYLKKLRQRKRKPTTKK